MLKAHMPENLTEEALGRRIRTARVDGKLTQQELAAAIGADQPTVSRLEAGKDVSTLVLTRIARATGKDVDFFLRPDAIAEAEYFMRDGEATEPGMVRAIDEMGKLIEDYEFLTRLRQ
jgi:transcriptional regulator with XRE-family HTH domain